MPVGRIFTCTSSAPDRAVCQRKRDVAASYGVRIWVWYSSVAVKGSDKTGTVESAVLRFFKKSATFNHYNSDRLLILRDKIGAVDPAIASEKACIFILNESSLVWHSTMKELQFLFVKTDIKPVITLAVIWKHRRERNMIEFTVVGMIFCFSYFALSLAASFSVLYMIDQNCGTINCDCSSSLWQGNDALVCACWE